MPQDIRFYDDGKGNVRQVAADKVDRFKSMFPDAKEAGENQLTEIESKRATKNEQQRLAGSDINVSVPTVQKVDLTLSDNQNPFSRKGMKGAIDISNAHHRSDPDVQFRAKYGAYKDNPELHRDEDAPEMVERRKKQPWYSYIGGGNAVVNATKQNQYGEENQEGATKTRQSQDYLETRTNKADKHKEKDLLSDFLTNTQSGRDAVEYDKDVTKYFEELKPKLEQQIADLENEITRKSTERRKLLERGVPGTRFGVKQSWLSDEDKEKIKQAKQKDTEEADKIATANDLQEATNSLKEMKMMRDAVSDRDANAFKQFYNEFGRRMPQALFDIGTLGVKEIFDEAAPQETDRLTDKADDLFANYQHAISNLYQHETSMAQDIANGGLHTLGFMAQMAATGGIATGIAAGATKGVGKALLKEGSRKFITKNTAKGVGKVVKIAGKNISEAFVQTVLMPSTLAGALEKNAEQPGSFLNAYATNFISAFGEVGLERVGDFVPGPKFKTPFMKKVTELTHMNSFPGEMLEENLQTAWNALFQTGEGEWADLVDPRNQLVTAGTIGLMQLPGGVIESGGYAAGKYRIAAQKRSIKKGYQQNVSNMNKMFGDDTQEILASLDETLSTIEDSSEAMLRLVASVNEMGETLDEKQQDAVVNYGLSFIAMKGVEKAKQEAKESAKQANAETLKGYVNESTGTVTLVDVADMDTPVAVQGDIVFTEDGKIDAHKSGVLYYTDNNGKKQVVNPQFVDLVESTPADEVEDVLNQTSEQEIENEYANDEVRAYEAGEVIRYAVNEQQSIVGTIQGVDNNGNYIVYVDGFGEATIEPRMIVPEDNLKGVQNGTMVEYTNDKGEVVVGEVQDMISLRNAGLVMIDGQEVPTQNVIGIEGTTEAENATIEEEATQQEAEETEVTPEQQAEQEKETFIQSLPVNNKGEIDQKQMTTAQTMQYFEYQYGVDETLKAAEQQAKNKEKQLKSAQTALNNDPFNIAKREKVDAVQAELEEYKAYVFDKKKTKAQEIAATSTSSIAEEQAKQEIERTEAEAQRQAEQADIEALQGIPDVTVDKAKDARARGYRSVNGERVNRQEATVPTTYTEAQRKFSDKESVAVKRTIVEAEGLQPSHKNGVKNDNFFITEAQPKPRTDDASQHAAESIASNINPQEITGGVTAYTGAPIVNSHGEVIQGNNRVTGLQLMHDSNKDGAAKYKQHLIGNAADYGMTADQVQAMNNPVAVDVAEVSDADAIRLGQLSQQDTESGGIQRVPAKQTSVALGENMGRFAQILFESINEDAISTVIEKNGRKAIDYLRQNGVINPTQYQSAFDKDGNITPEAKKDLQDIASQMLFENANSNIEQMFDALPDKAQKAILQTIHRDAKSPKSERIVKELQQAIEAYYHLQGHDGFSNATDYKSATIAARAAKNSTVMFNSESNLPLQKYSNFAMELAILFKADTQKALRQRFNSLYDNIQGVGGDVFNAAEKLSLAEAIKNHFNNIYYVSDGQTKRPDVAGDSKTSGKGRQEGAGEAASGERTKTGGKPTDSGAGTNTDNKQSGKANPNITEEREIAKAIEELSAKLNTPIVVYNSAKEIPKGKHSEKQARSKGWFDPNTGQVFINLFNAENLQDARETVLHEVVGHKGLRDMLGKEKHRELLEGMFEFLPKNIQDAYLSKYGSKYGAMDEYIAYLAQNEKNLTPQEKGTWESIKQAIIDFIENHIGIKLKEQNVDDVIRGLLVESKKRLENKGKVSVEKGKVDNAKQPWEMTKEEYRQKHIADLENWGAEKDAIHSTTSNEWYAERPNKFGSTRRSKTKKNLLENIIPFEKKRAIESINNGTIDWMHEAIVDKALSEGKAIPESTLKEYPELSKKKDSPINLVELSTQVAAKEKLKQEEKRKEQPAEKIEDFGEVIEGAKKHTYQRIETTETDMQSQPLSKTFPKPNYSKLVEDGVLTKKGAMVLKHAYEALPSKPRKKYRIAAWVKEVEAVIATYNSMIENKEFGDSLHDKLVKLDSFDSDYSSFVEIQKAFGFPEKDVNMGAYRVIPPNKVSRSTGIDMQWLIVKGNSIHGKADSAEGIARVFNQMVDKNKKKGVALSIYRDTKTNEYFIGRKTGGGITRLVDGMTREEAVRMAKEEMPKLQEMWEARKVKPEERRKENRKRVGTDYRKGKDVTPEQFGEAFGFRGVQFGNWVNSAERQESLNDAYDAFMDLSNAIGVSPRALSLAGELGMAFGARGSGNAMAHYESGKVVINLTKTKGAGSLAHEWWHAMDSYFSRMRGEKQGFLTESPRQKYKTDGGKRVLDTSIRTEMHEAFLEVMNAINNSDLPKRSKELDKSRSNAYWATQLEMSARAFEGYIIDKLGETGEQNDYLANFKDTGEWASSSAFDMKNYPYPTVDENASINEAFESLFDAMQEKEEDGKQIIYRDNQDFRDAHTSPTMGHETLEEATDESGDVSLSEVITGKQELVPDNFFDTRKGRLKNGSVGYMGAIRYGFNTKSGTETFDAIKALQEKVKKGISPTKIKARAYRAVPNKVEVNELIDRDWVTLSKDYAEKHGLARFGEGEYKIIEQDVPVNKLWWDGNDPNEWGYDVEENIRYRIVEDSNQQEIEEERSKYNGQSYMLVGDKVNYTIYTPTESADSYSESGEQTIDFSEAYANVDDLTDQNNSNYSGIIYGLNAVDVEVDLEDVKSKMGYEEDIYDGDIDSFLEEVMSEYVVQTDDFKELDTRFIHRYKSELDNQGTDEMIDDVMESLRTETGANIKKYSSFFVDRDGNMTNESFDRQNEDLENISVTMRIGNHTHNPSNGRNDLNVLIADKDETRGAFRGARTDLEFSSDYTVDEIAQEIKDYWQSFARQEYEDYRESDIRYRETDRPQFSDAIETVVERFVDRITLKENESQKEAPNLRKLINGKIKDYELYDRYKVVPVSDPVVNIHNVARSIYTLGDRLYDLNNLHKQALLNFDGDTGYLNASDVQHFSNQFRHAIEPYEAGLLKAKHFATEAAQREIMDIIKDIDHAKDYYERLAKDHNVLRSEDAPRFRDAESISELADMVGSDMTEEARKEYDKKYNSFASRFREAWEDSYLPVKQFQDLLEKNGLKIEEHNDYYKQATHVPGKNDFQLEHYKKTYQHPITLAVNALQEKGLTYREIENYVFAKHGIERNEFMRRDEAKTYANAIRQRAEIKAMQEQRSIDNKLSNDNIDKTEHEKQTSRIERAKQKKLQESNAVEERKYQELQDKDYAGLTQLMEEINPEGVEQGRALEEMAEEYNKDFEGKAGEKLINSLWGKIKKATDFTLDNHYKTGGVSRGVYLELKGRYQNFVPLRGHDQEVAEDRWHYTQGNMGEFYSGAIIKAQGRRSRAESPFAYIGQMAHSSIMRGNKNALNQTLLRLAHKDKSGLMDVKRTWYVNKGTLENPMWEAEAAEFSDNIDTYLQNQIDFEERMKEMQEIGMAAQSSKHLNIGGLFIKPKQAEQHEIQVDQNGVHYTIYINANPAIARAINGDNKKSIAKGMGFIGNVTRAMAMNFTTRNPLFIARNFSRDYIYANTMLMVKEDATYTARFNKNIPLAFAALTRQKRGTLDLNNETDAYVYEFMMNGGRTGFSHIFELKRAAKALEREAKKGDSKSALDYGRVALGAIDVVNDVVENATRLSTYMASRQAGRSITQSVHEAKNVTVNFNQKGAGSSIGNNSFERFMLSAAGWVRPLYLFTNAAVQALSNVGKATKKHPVKMGAAITSFALMGFLSPIIAGMIGGDDEEDDFMKMSDWDRQNNWCIPVGSGYIKIPLPHEMRVFHRLGDNIYQASTGRKDTLETMLDMMFALSDLAPMNPLGAADASWAELMPDVIKPYLQHHATNTSFMGTRIYNQWANPYAPGYTKVSTNKKGEAYAPAFLVELYKNLDRITGGDGVKKGVVSLNPDVTNHYMRGWFGGLWTIAEQSVDIGYKAAEWSKTGELNLKVRETPLSSFYTDKNDLNVSSGATGQRYYEIMKDVNEARRRSKGYVKKVREGEMSIHELAKKMEELDMPKVNALYERVKEVKAMEARLKDVDGKEQKDLEKEIFEKKKMVVEMK